jgi:hypothetical protein
MSRRPESGTGPENEKSELPFVLKCRIIDLF